MAFDAGMVSFVSREIDTRLKNAKVEKIYQPTKEEVIFAVRGGGETNRLLINVGSSNARLNLTSMKPDNPANPPMFCMMLRKHLQGAKIISSEQMGFERAVRITFDAYDELGFKSPKHVIVEIMGTYSNLIVTDKDDRILGAAKLIDASPANPRQILPGMIYEMPPIQKKENPLEITRERFLDMAASADESTPCEKFIVSSFLGIAPVNAREISYRSCKNTAGTLYDCRQNLEKEFFSFVEIIKSGKGTPSAVFIDKKAREYSFMPLTQYGADSEVRRVETFGELIDTFFSARAHGERIKQRASDVSRIISNAERRISKKLALLANELADCDEGEKFRLWGDLITANIYRLKRGMEGCSLENYMDEMREVKIPLDTRMTPAQNAQKYYKKYAKTKSAKEHLALQIDIAEKEYEYIYTVADCLSRATTEKEISEIRSELYHSGYASKMRGYTERKKQTPTFIKYKTSGGYTVLCGKNNLANDYITFKVAEKSDWWFHVKGQPGSHVLMQCPRGEEPSELDFTEACIIAAVNSKAGDGAGAEVDYTLAKNVRKPPSSKPGYVIYHTNYSARVIPDKAVCDSLMIK